MSFSGQRMDWYFNVTLPAQKMSFTRLFTQNVYIVTLTRSVAECKLFANDLDKVIKIANANFMQILCQFLINLLSAAKRRLQFLDTPHERH